MKRALLWIVIGISVAIVLRLFLLEQSRGEILADLTLISVMLCLFFTAAQFLQRRGRARMKKSQRRIFKI